MKVWVPNAHLKFQIVDRDPIWLALLGAVYYARLNSNGEAGSLIDVPLSLFVSSSPVGVVVPLRP